MVNQKRMVFGRLALLLAIARIILQTKVYSKCLYQYYDILVSLPETMSIIFHTAVLHFLSDLFTRVIYNIYHIIFSHNQSVTYGLKIPIEAMG